MRSGELAQLAGVTVRTLRHYHQVGVLAEPRRRHNGYRHYDVHDLVRVLRIRRLASLGIPLDRVGDLLDDDRPADPNGLLDELDAELAAQIDRLIRQRELVMHLRRHGSAPDLPPELAPFLAVFADTRLPRELATFDRDQSVLLAHLADESALAHLVRFYERLSDPDVAPVATAIFERFGQLEPDSTDTEVEDLADAFMTALAPLLDDLTATDPPVDLSAAADVIAAYSADVLNEQQRRVLTVLERRLGERSDAALETPSGTSRRR